MRLNVGAGGALEGRDLAAPCGRRLDTNQPRRVAADFASRNDGRTHSRRILQMLHHGQSISSKADPAKGKNDFSCDISIT
jgi:hypothetical protein